MESELWPIVLLVGGGILAAFILNAATRGGRANGYQEGYQRTQWQPPMPNSYYQNPWDSFFKFFACIGIGAVCLLCFCLGLLIAWNGW